MDRAFKQPNFTSSQQHFSHVPKADIPRSKFDRSHQYKTTLNSGVLVPILVDEVLPGDTFHCKMTSFARLATPLVPFMDTMFADVHFFFVPNRLLWSNWERLNGAQDNPTDSTSFLVPQVATPGPSGFQTGSLADYFGIPVGVVNAPSVNALHFRAYNLIWNTWYRDQNLQNSVAVPLDNGPDVASNYVVLPRNKRADYFNSALPFTQKGPAVSLSLGTFAPITSIGPTGAIDGSVFLHPTSTTTSTYLQGPSTGTTLRDTYAGTGILQWPTGAETTGAGPGYKNVANLSAATAVTINALRQAFQMQRMLERDARGGTRYTEILLAHFGVSAPDFRLQRPEYLGGGHTTINSTPIAQTSATGEGGSSTPQGNLAAISTFSHHGVGFHKSFVEHGVILGLLSIRANYTYQQGLHRMWTRQTRYDFYWPALSHLGEQAILNQEIYVQNQTVLDGNGKPVNQDVFGYQERYAEYRYKPSIVTGQFRSTSTTGTPLDFWHLAFNFGSLPVLGDTFIRENPPVNRVLAVSDAVYGANQFLFDAVFDFKCARPMPVYSVPGLVDHF